MVKTDSSILASYLHMHTRTHTHTHTHTNTHTHISYPQWWKFHFGDMWAVSKWAWQLLNLNRLYNALVPTTHVFQGPRPRPLHSSNLYIKNTGILEKWNDRKFVMSRHWPLLPSADHTLSKPFLSQLHVGRGHRRSKKGSLDSTNFKIAPQASILYRTKA